MKKIPTIFKRNPENMRELLNEPNPDCLWVFNDKIQAVIKYDGTCCKIENRKLFKRREVKKGKEAPLGFVEEMHDQNTGKPVGWVLVDFDLKENKYHLEAYRRDVNRSNGTYELVGPKIQGNPEGFDSHVLLEHNMAKVFYDVPMTFDGLRDWLKDKNIEGLIFLWVDEETGCNDGRMAKIKKKDFGLIR